MENEGGVDRVGFGWSIGHVKLEGDVGDDRISGDGGEVEAKQAAAEITRTVSAHGHGQLRAEIVGIIFLPQSGVGNGGQRNGVGPGRAKTARCCHDQDATKKPEHRIDRMAEGRTRVKPWGRARLESLGMGPARSRVG
jgi:hypothetical protein